MTTIRKEQPGDIFAVRVLYEKSFQQSIEANIVDALRAACPEALSLVAIEGDNIVGHILFSPVTVKDKGREIAGMGLAPMAVLPERQRRGIGSKLVKAGLKTLKEQECPFTVVLGHSKYYPRFGFTPASQRGLACKWPSVPNEVFMVLILDEEAMKEVSGIARYRAEFDAAT